MTKKELTAKVEDLGQLREQLGEITKAASQLGDAVRKGLKTLKLTELASAQYSACLDERRSLVVSPAKLRRKLSDKLFMACIRVDVAETRRHIPPADLKRLGTYAKSEQLRVTRRPTKKKEA